MPPELVALSEGPSILLDKPIVLVGRHQECDIQIASRKISRRHCCLAQVNEHLVVRDLCSTNGIRINGVRVNEACLKTGDELTIGNFRYEVRLEGQPPPPRVPTKSDREPANNAFLSLDQPVVLKDSANLLAADIPQAAGVKPPPEKKDGAPLPPGSAIVPDDLELASASGGYGPDSKS